MYRVPIVLQFTRNMRQRGMDSAVRDLLSLLTRPAVAPNLPRHLQIEVTTYCNLRCIMCPRTVMLAEAKTYEEGDIWLRHLPFSRFQAIIKQLPQLNSISLHGIGEPLLHPHLFDMIEVASARGIRVRFTTNATLLTPTRIERLLASKLHRLIISLDGATAHTYEKIRVRAVFEQVIGNIEMLMRKWERMDKNRPHIDINMVVNRVNLGEVNALIDLVASLGVGSVLLSPLEPSSPSTQDLVCDVEDWRHVTQMAKRHARKVGVKLFTRGGTMPIMAMADQNAEKRTDRCLYPWTTAVVTLNGEVMPCCNIYHIRHSMGNAFEGHFETVWNGSRYQAFRLDLKQRDHVPEPCSWCPEF